MKIGVDVDGVLLDFEKGMLVQAELYDMDVANGKGKVNKNTYFVQNKYDWTDKEKANFIKENLEKISENSCVMAGVKEIIPRLQKQGHEVIIISTKGTEDEKMVEIATKKLEEANIHFDKYIWKVKNKLAIARKEKIDIMIDDSPTICENFAENRIQTIYLRGIMGQDVSDSPFLLEVTDWGEIYRYISNTNEYAVRPQIIEYVRSNIFPVYERDNSGHGIDHIKQVIDRSFEIMKENELDLDRNMVYTIAAYHDIGHQADPKTHEKISAKMFCEDNEIKKWFTKEQISTIKDAIEDHRASCKREPRNIYGKLVSTADRTILDIDEYIRRTYLYGLKNNSELKTEEDRLNRVYEHLSEKYGENGYARICLPDEKLEISLQKIRRALKNKEKFIKRAREVTEKL